MSTLKGLAIAAKRIQAGLPVGATSHLGSCICSSRRGEGRRTHAHDDSAVTWRLDLYIKRPSPPIPTLQRPDLRALFSLALLFLLVARYRLLARSWVTNSGGALPIKPRADSCCYLVLTPTRISTGQAVCAEASLLRLSALVLCPASYITLRLVPTQRPACQRSSVLAVSTQRFSNQGDIRHGRHQQALVFFGRCECRIR